MTYNLLADPADSQATLSWTVTPDPAETITKFQYRQKRSPGGSNPWRDIPDSGPSGPNSKTYTVTGLTNCETYSFQVRAIYNIGSANSSGYASAKPLIERTPTFDIGSVTLIVAENTARSTKIGNPITATGGSCDTLTYSLDQTSQAAFDINQSTGQLLTKAALDYESKNNYRVRVTATSQSQESATIQVTITVTDVNEPPAFPSAETGARTIAENTPEGRPIGAPVDATDPEQDTLTYTLGGTDLSSFTIESSTGQIKVGAGTTLDYETKTKNSYTVTVTANDGNGGSDSIDVTITVTDVNEPPEITETGGASTFNHPENDTSAVHSYAATDPESDSITWSLSGTDRGDFSITGGVLTFSQTPNFEASVDANRNNVYLVTVNADDGNGGSDTVDVTVTVTDVNEPPTFNEGDTTARSIAENTPANTNVGSPLRATDPDSGDTLTYSLDSTGAASFAIVAPSGQLETKVDLDKETTSIYTITVSVRDSKGAEGNADTATDDTITVTINVTDVNEPPDITKDGDGAGNTINYPENGPDSVHTYSATDPEGDSITWSLSGVDWRDFLIGNAGVLTFRRSPDFEAPADANRNNVYRVTVNANDGKSGRDYIRVTVTVTNVDEAGTVTLPRRTEARVSITATLTDLDGGVTNEAWTWYRSSDNSTWMPISEETSATYTPADSDVDKYLRATVFYTDAQGIGKKAQAVSSGTVRDGPNRPPEFPDQDDGTPDVQNTHTTREVPENTAPGEDIGDPVSAEDADSDTLTYSLEGRNKSSFAIVATSGQLQTKAALNYESKRSYSVRVKADDSKGGTAIIAMTITVTDLDEEGTVTLSSTQPRVSSRLTPTLSDPDAVVTGVTWQWASSSTAQRPYGDITGATSASYTPVAVDVGKYLQATATYTDKFGSNKNAQAVSTNAVQAARSSPSPQPPPSNRAPSFDAQTTTRTVAENRAAGVNIGNPIAATDPDTLTYSLGGDDAGSFDIVAASGQLRTQAALDYESKASHTVTVRATDTGGLSDTINVNINVTNTEEAGRVTLLPEQPRAGTELTATLTDPDGSVSGVSWQWAESADQSAWDDIQGATVAVYTLVAGDVDKYLRATASYTDGHDSGKTAEGVTKIAVQPSGDNTPPVFPDAETRARSVAENTPAGENVGDPVTATDDDDDTLTYSLGGRDAESFDIEAATGQLKTRAALDYETRNSYSLKVSVSDGKDAGGAADVAADTTIELTVAVTDVKEVPGRPAAPTVEADSTRRLSVTWQEPDNTGPPINGYDVEYRPRGGGSEVKEETTPGGSRTLTVSGLEAGTAYEARVRARNAEGDGEWSPWGSGNTRRVVSRRSSRGGGGWVSPAPESNRPPVFTEGESTERWAAEQTTAGTHIGPPVAATDPDGDPLTYSLAGFTGPFFSMDRHTGQLKVRAALDFDAEPSYTGIVNVSDSRGGSDSIVLNITVVEVPVVGSPAPSPTATPVATGEPTATPLPPATPTPTIIPAAPAVVSDPPSSTAAETVEGPIIPPVVSAGPVAPVEETSGFPWWLLLLIAVAVTITAAGIYAMRRRRKAAAVPVAVTTPARTAPALAPSPEATPALGAPPRDAYGVALGRDLMIPTRGLKAWIFRRRKAAPPPEVDQAEADPAEALPRRTAPAVAGPARAVPELPAPPRAAPGDAIPESTVPQVWGPAKDVLKVELGKDMMVPTHGIYIAKLHLRDDEDFFEEDPAEIETKIKPRKRLHWVRWIRPYRWQARLHQRLTQTGLIPGKCSRRNSIEPK